MSETKHERRLGPRDISETGDIKYVGPITYRGFKILGWLCAILSLAVVVLTVIIKVNPNTGEKLQSPQQILSYVSRLAALFLLISAISRIMTKKGEYAQQLLTYGGLVGIVAVGYCVFYHATVVNLINWLFLEPEMVKPMVEDLIASVLDSGFFALNVFVDIFLCLLIFFFLNVQPKRVFTGSRIKIVRALTVLPFIWVIVCIVLKIRAFGGKMVLPYWIFPFLTTRSIMVYILVLALSIYVKKEENRYCYNGRTIEDYQKVLTTRQSSLWFGVSVAVALVAAAVLDNLLQYVVARILMAKPMNGADETALAWGLRAAKHIGFGGDSVPMLVMVPLMLLYSFNRVPKWRFFSIISPLLAILLIILFMRISSNAGTSEYIFGNVGKISVVRIEKMIQNLDKVKFLVQTMLL